MDKTNEFAQSVMEAVQEITVAQDKFKAFMELNEIVSELYLDESLKGQLTDKDHQIIFEVLLPELEYKEADNSVEKYLEVSQVLRNILPETCKANCKNAYVWPYVRTHLETAAPLYLATQNSHVSELNVAAGVALSMNYQKYILPIQDHKDMADYLFETVSCPEKRHYGSSYAFNDFVENYEAAGLMLERCHRPISSHLYGEKRKDHLIGVIAKYQQVSLDILNPEDSVENLEGQIEFYRTIGNMMKFLR